MKYKLLLLITIVIIMLVSGCASNQKQESQDTQPTVDSNDTAEPFRILVQTQKKPKPELAIIGELENITFVNDEVTLQARIDTGAANSAIGVKEQALFNLDGKKWVRFIITDPFSKVSKEFKHPLKRFAQVKRSNGGSQDRMVVAMEVKMGNISQQQEFMLVGGGKFAYPVIIGRDFLKNKAIVDVSRKFSLSTTSQK